MTEYTYHLLDVFTDRKFTGNQLAVLPDARGLTDRQMQDIAREFNLSETTFVFPPENEKNDFKLRIFTPASEIEMAGHPTVGTAYLLVREGMIQLSDNTTTVVFEEQVGEIPVEIESSNKTPGTIWMNQPLPQFSHHFDDRTAVARMLSLDPSDLSDEYPLEVVSCGVPFLIIPLVSLEVIEQTRLRYDIWEKVMADHLRTLIMPFTTETQRSDSTVHCRMFAPSEGIAEDPATGSANGPLGCYLVRHKIVAADPVARIISEQGFEMGRPSILRVQVTVAQDKITSVKVGGNCVYVGSGTISV